MRNLLKNQLFFIIMAMLTILFISFIFFHSSMTAETSSQESTGIQEVLQDILDTLCIPLVLTEHIVRKTAHFCEFAVLGVLTSLTFYAYDKNFKKYIKRFISALFVCLATAVSDETIQLYVPGRSGQITDVWVDFSGAITGALFISLVLFLIYKAKNRTDNCIKINVAD